MDLKLLAAVEDYLAGNVSVDDLALFVTSVTWDNPTAPPVAHAIEHAIDEAASGAMSRDEMNERLAQLIAQPAFA